MRKAHDASGGRSWTMRASSNGRLNGLFLSSSVWGGDGGRPRRPRARTGPLGHYIQLGACDSSAGPPLLCDGPADFSLNADCSRNVGGRGIPPHEQEGGLAGLRVRRHGSANLRLTGSLLPKVGDRVFQRLRAQVAGAATPDAYGAVLDVAVAQDELDRYLLQLVFPDALGHLLVTGIHFRAEAGRPQRGADLIRVGLVPVGDRDERDLLRREPEREVATVVFDQHAQEALRRTGDGAVQHDRRALLALLVDILAAEPRRLDEIDLDRADLPLAAENVVRHEVGLRAVERRLAGRLVVSDARRIER